MIFSRYINRIAAGTLTAALAAMLWGCATEDFDPMRVTTTEDYDPDTQLVVRLAVPQGAVPATRSVNSAPTSKELDINSLRILIFPAGGGDCVVNSPLMLPDELAVDPEEGSVTYQFKGFTPGQAYKIFVVGNLPHDALAAISTEAKLREYIMDYTKKLPEAGNLPMIYEETGESTFEIEQNPTAPVKRTLSMKYACVKVKLNLLFDPDYELADGKKLGDLYGTAGFKPTTISLSHASEKAPLLIYNQKGKVEGDATISLKDRGAYYTSWTETPDNANKSDDIITLGDAAGGAFTGYAGKWLWQETVYLPERYTETGEPLTFNLEGKLTDAEGNVQNSTVKFESVAIGVADEADGVADTDLPRGSYYEFIGHIASKELEGARLNASVTVKKWDELTLPVDFIHTYLTLDKTMAHVESLTNDHIVYNTDGEGGATFECESTIKGEPILVGTAKYDPAIGNYIELAINPAIDVLTIPEGEDKRGADNPAKGWIVAGNIKKQVKFTYDITPFFIITPTERTIAYQDGSDNVTYFAYRTNLGGIQIKDEAGSTLLFGVDGAESYTTAGTSNITITMTDGAAPSSHTGQIQVTAKGMPSSTMTYNFVACPPKQSSRGNNDTRITVTVQPPLTEYVINFRAINDYATQRDGNGYANEFLAVLNYTLPKEGGSNNWIDFWNNSKDASGPEHHYIYIYNQIGNNKGSSIDEMPVCQFTLFSDKGTVREQDRMSQDSNNPGWYSRKLSKTATGTWLRADKLENPDDKEKYSIPRPGETLLIFHDDNGNGNTIHRLAHEKEAGVPLGSFSDGEGWTVYDPLSATRYTTYDDKPVIVDVEYTIYSDVPLTGWEHEYGNVGGNKIKMYANRWAANTANQNVKEGNYYKNTLHFKAVQGEYDKAVIIKFEGESLNNDYVPDTSGQYIWFYDDGNWNWSRPAVYFHDTNWSSDCIEMTLDTGRTGKYYYLKVPADKRGSKIVLRDLNSQNQWPSGENRLELNNTSHIFTTSKKTDNPTDGWETTTFYPLSAGSGVVKIGSQLFDGNNWTTGTFNSKTGTWTEGKP
ncbi:MAG: hypothetical protein K2I37_01190 [Muribaculaceae bacterium]|nr:hypothetical protein [Muribaculaceae bacterium]